MKIDFKDKQKLIIAIMIGAVAIILVATIFLQVKSVEEYKKADIEGLRDDELRTQISLYKTQYEDALEQYQENQNKIEEYRNTVNENEKASELLDKELEQTKILLGLTEVKGEGVTVTLTNTNVGGYIAENIVTLINELKYAGAEAISINGNRIINLADIVDINVENDRYLLIYGNTRLKSPYIIKAIGDTTYLTSTLNMKNTGYVDLMKSNGLGITVEQSKNITIEPYTGKIENKYMKEGEQK